MGTPAAAEEVEQPAPDATQTAWTATAYLVPVILGLVSTLGAVDLAYHLRTGQGIVADLALPSVDTFTFSVDGARWVDQQWGGQVVLWLTFRLGGWPGLVVLQAALGAVSFGFIFMAARARGASARLAAALTLAGFLMAYPMITLRPQLVALPLFAAALWAAATWKDHPRRSWIIPLGALLAVNMHGSFTLFPIIAMLVVLRDLADRAEDLRRSAIVLGATVIATFANPFGVSVWTYAFDLSTDPVIRESITEWAPVSVATSMGAIMLASVLLVGAILARRTRPASWLDLLTLAVFLILALSAMRAILWWAMVAPIVLAGLIRDRRGEKRDPSSPRGPAVILIGGLTMAIVALLPWWRGTGPGTHVEGAPLGVTRALERLGPETRIFSYQPWGSWFIYALREDRVFVDSRIEIVPESVWQDYFQVAFARARWKEALVTWGPDAVVADNDEWAEIIELLGEDRTWRLYYEDDEGTIFVPR